MSNDGIYTKQMYSQSSTNLNMHSYDQGDGEMKGMMRENNNRGKNSLQYSLSQQNNNREGGMSVPSLTVSQNQSVGSINQSNNNNNKSQLNNNNQQ